MPGARITIDGLWACLCPSIDVATLLRAAGRPSSPLLRVPIPRAASRVLRPSRPAHRYRCVASLHAGPDPRANDGSADGGESDPRFTKYAYGHVREGQGEDRTITAKQLLRGEGLLSKAGISPRLHEAPAPAIYEALRALQGRPGRRGKIRALVQYLVESRDEKPNAFLYEALMVSNWDVAGSAEEVKDLLEEMKTLGVEGTSGLYHAALRALAVHPDYLQRNTILRAMKERWIDLTAEGEHSVALGLLRDGQYELALNALDRLARDKVAVPAWLYDTFTFVLGQSGFVDEAVRLLRKRLQHDEAHDAAAVPLNTWYYLLDECSGQLYYEGTKFVWDRMVQSKTLVPPDGMCLNVLNTAARHGDSKLATQAIQHLPARGVKLGPQHFEALVDCYSHGNDLENALEVLCIMRNAGIASDRGSTRSIYLSLKRSPGLAAAAVDALFRLGTRHEIPISAFNVVVEGLCATGHSDKALDLYHEVRRLCSSGPALETFEPLMEKCEDAQTAQFLASEMSAFSIRPSRAVFDQLVYLSALDGDVEAAFRTMGEMGRVAARGGQRKTAESWITRRTAVALAKRCFAVKDERVWDLLDASKRRGMDLAEDLPSYPVGQAGHTDIERDDLRSGVVIETSRATAQPVSG